MIGLSDDPRIRSLEVDLLMALASNDPGFCLYFRGMEARTGISAELCRPLCRSLRLGKIVEYSRSVFNDSGEVVGVGYYITDKGRETLREYLASKGEESGT